MDTNGLIQLIETVSKTLNEQGFEHISINHEGSSITLNKQSVSGSVQQVAAAPVYATPATASVPAKAMVSGEASKQAVPEATTEVTETEDDGNFVTIDSPIVGTFYDAPSPEAEAFVKVGDKVKKGDVVCIIEAMKLMNEIEAECDGEIAEILVSNEGPVEYGQSLFKIKQ